MLAKNRRCQHCDNEYIVGRGGYTFDEGNNVICLKCQRPILGITPATEAEAQAPFCSKRTPPVLPQATTSHGVSHGTAISHTGQGIIGWSGSSTKHTHVPPHTASTGDDY